MEILFPESKEVKGYFENNQYLEIEKIMKHNNYYFYQITQDGLKRVENLEYNEIDRNYLFSSKKSKNLNIPYTKINKEII
jgi:hypothetical protein